MNPYDASGEIDRVLLESWELDDEHADPWSGETGRRAWRPARPVRRRVAARPLRRRPLPRPRPWPRPRPPVPWRRPPVALIPVAYPVPSPEPAYDEPPLSEPEPTEPEPAEPEPSEPEPSAAAPSTMEPSGGPAPESVAAEAGTARSLTPGFFKDAPAIQQAPLRPASQTTIDPAWPSIRKQIGKTFNRVGGLMQSVGAQVGIEPAAALAVWHVESAGRAHTPDKALIRFENHLLFRRWGKAHPRLYDRHFRHGGHQGETGKAWHNHKFRESANGPFHTFHGNQALEYKVLHLASRLAGREIALSCISIGGPQILISNHAMIGYPSGQAMYEAFQKSERWQVLGFFDFCRHRQAPRRGDMFVYLRARNWRKFARYYNGPGQVEVYGGRIGNAYGHARAIGA